MKEFFENLDMEKYHAMKNWLGEEDNDMAKELLSFFASIEKSAAETYGISFDCPLPETKEIEAFCNHCNEKFSLPWNLKKHGMKVHCPYCGEEIRLCACCPMDEECDYDAETGNCRYCRNAKTDPMPEQKEDVRPAMEKPEKVKKVEDALSSSTQELFKHLKETYPKYWKKVVDYAQEYLQEIDVKEKRVKQEASRSEWNTKMSYQLFDKNGVQDYQEVIFPGLLTENQKRTILSISRNREFYPSIFRFPCQHDAVYQLLGFTKTKERPTTDILPEDFVNYFCSMCNHWDLYEFFKNNF